MNFRFSLLLSFSSLFFSCNEKYVLEISQHKADSLLAHYNKGMIVSCFRCGCIDEYLTPREIKQITEHKILLLTDTNCLIPSLQNHAIHFPQKNLDSLWEMNYNVLLFSRKDGQLQYDLLKTGEHLREKTISFFKE